MAKKLLLMVTLSFMLICMFASCDNNEHIHSFGEWQTVKTATCMESGINERYCECGEKQTQTIYALGHQYGEWVITNEPKCTETGSKERYCECGDKQTQTIALGHRYGDWGITKEATCTEDGSKERYCECGDKQTQNVPALGHNSFTWRTTKEATCTTEGTKAKVCRCGEIVSTEVIPSLDGHKYVDGICSGCKKEVERIVLTNKNSTIIIPDFPFEVKCSVLHVNIESFEWSEESSHVDITISGEVTYLAVSQSRYVNFKFKIYDSEGYVVYYDSVYLSNYLAQGDKFKDETFSFDLSSLEENKEYTLKMEVLT